MQLPPSSRMQTSNEPRVRVDGLEKIRPHVCPAKACGPINARFFFKSLVARRIEEISSGESCSMLRRCFIEKGYKCYKSYIVKTARGWTRSSRTGIGILPLPQGE